MERMLVEIGEEILEETKAVELIFVSGSYALGRMQRYSDVDMWVLTRTKPKRRHIFRFVTVRGRKVLLTVPFHKLSSILEAVRKPKTWVWTYMCYGQAKVLFDKNQNMEKTKAVLEEYRVLPETFLKSVPLAASYLVEYAGKLKNAYRAKDEPSLFLAARTIAILCHGILRPFNPVWKYASERETYRSYLQLESAPTHYVKDFRVCYGLTMNSRTIDEIYKSAMRLARETTDFLRRNKIEKKIADKKFLLFFNSKEYADFLKP